MQDMQINNAALYCMYTIVKVVINYVPILTLYIIYMKYVIYRVDIDFSCIYSAPIGFLSG